MRQERAVETRARLLDATMEVLFERGWAGTSTSEVCRRSGVSRGSLLHQFPSRDHLILAAVGRMFEMRIEEFVAAIRSLDASEPPFERLDAAIDVLWGIYRGPTMTLWHDLVVAARTDATLGAVVKEVQRAVDDAVAEQWLELFPRTEEFPEGFHDLAPTFLLTLLNGLALSARIDDDRAVEDQEAVVVGVKVITRLFSRLSDGDLDELVASVEEAER